MINSIKYIIFVMGLVGSNYPMKAEAMTVAHSFSSHLSNNRNMNQEEIWKDINGYEGLYQVSNFGEIKSLLKRYYNKDIILKGSIGNGYHGVTLVKNKILNRLLVHRLVAIAFIPNPKNKPCVNHIDGNKLNNKIPNLEWCTHAENMIHSFKALNRKPAWKGKKNSDHNCSKKIKQLSKKDGNVISTFNSIFEASKSTGISRTHIGEVCNKKRISAGNFKWEYLI